jgi:hypothetical protein
VVPIFGEADEPEEDLFKPSCTLFRRGSSEYDDSYYELGFFLCLSFVAFWITFGGEK